VLRALAVQSTNRPAAVVNLDPANDTLPYDCAVDVCDLICMADVADTFGLGPNGGTVFRG
jgi:GPN-loop GTPase